MFEKQPPAVLAAHTILARATRCSKVERAGWRWYQARVAGYSRHEPVKK
jgi:hypothetical protein